MLFFSGFGHVGNCVVGYAYMSENLHSDHLKIGASLMFATEGSSLFVPIIYYNLIGDNWKGIYGFAFILSIISTIIVFLQPETPAFLRSTGDKIRLQ